MTNISDNDGPLLDAFHAAVQQIAGLVAIMETVTQALELSADTALKLLNGEELPEREAAREGLEAIAQTLMPAMRTQLEVNRAGVEKNQRAYALFVAMRQVSEAAGSLPKES